MSANLKKIAVGSKRRQMVESARRLSSISPPHCLQSHLLIVSVLAEKWAFTLGCFSPLLGSSLSPKKWQYVGWTAQSLLCTGYLHHLSAPNLNSNVSSCFPSVSAHLSLRLSQWLAFSFLHLSLSLFELRMYNHVFGLSSCDFWHLYKTFKTVCRIKKWEPLNARRLQESPLVNVTRDVLWCWTLRCFARTQTFIFVTVHLFLVDAHPTSAVE